MAWYRASGYLRTFISKSVSKRSAPQQLISRTNLLNNPTSSFFSRASPRLQCNFQAKKWNLYYTPWSSARCYSIGRNQVGEFKRKAGYVRYMAHPVSVFIILVLGSGISASLYYGYFETIPYTKRKHFLFVPMDREIRVVESEFVKLKQEWKSMILPEQHPESIRFCSITKTIILALERGSRNDEAWTDFSNAHLSEESIEGGDEWVEPVHEILDDDERIEQGSGRKKLGKEKGKIQCDNSHFKWFKWEVIILDNPVVYIRCLAGGKIIVSTGLLNHFKTDAELATLIAHEVGHAVARHLIENLTNRLWRIIAKSLLYPVLWHTAAEKMSQHVHMVPFSRRMELEADCIGLLLMASAGYDPRVAPLTYQKLWKLSDNKAFGNYHSTHPSSEKRAKLLNEAKVMQEAIDIYRELKVGREVKGFLL